MLRDTFVRTLRGATFAATPHTVVYNSNNKKSSGTIERTTTSKFIHTLHTYTYLYVCASYNFSIFIMFPFQCSAFAFLALFVLFCFDFGFAVFVCCVHMNIRTDGRADGRTGGHRHCDDHCAHLSLNGDPLQRYKKINFEVLDWVLFHTAGCHQQANRPTDQQTNRPTSGWLPIKPATRGHKAAGSNWSSCMLFARL